MEQLIFESKQFRQTLQEKEKKNAFCFFVDLPLFTVLVVFFSYSSFRFMTVIVLKFQWISLLPKKWLKSNTFLDVAASKCASKFATKCINLIFLENLSILVSHFFVLVLVIHNLRLKIAFFPTQNPFDVLYFPFGTGKH